MEKVVSELWDKVLEDVGKNVNESQFRAWFSPVKVRPDALDNGIFRIAVANRFIKNVLQRNYKQLIASSLEKHLGREPVVEFVISGELYQLLRKSQDSEYPGNGSTTEALEGNIETPLAAVVDGFVPTGRQQGRSSLNPSFTFSSFVEGESNRLASVVLKQVVKSPGNVYNPLVIYGDHGLGKTHLLQAAVHELEMSHPGISAAFIPAETFTNDYLQAVSTRSLEAFRNRLRSLDFLALDDFHFLLGKKQTLQEFRHTLDALVSSGRQVVLSMVSAPRETDGLPPALLSRMIGGLLAHLEAPDPDLRCEIIRQKARRWGGDLPEEVVHHIASHSMRNIREIEGSVAKLMAIASSERKAPDLQAARRALREYRALKDGPLSLEAIASRVAERFEMSTEELKGRSRLRSVAVPRQVAIYLAKQLTTYSLGEIGRFFGGRNHSTVLYAVNRIAAELSENRELQRIVQGIKYDLGR